MADLTEDADQRHRAWWKIKNKRYIVRIPSYLVPRDDMMLEYGTFTTGSRDADRIMASAQEQIWLPLIDLINIWIRGGSYTFVHPDKAIPDIHRILQEHIDDFIAAEEAYAAGILYEEEEIINNRRRDMLEVDEYARAIFYKAYAREISEKDTFKGFGKYMDPFRRERMVSKKRYAQPNPKYESIMPHVDYNSLRNKRSK